MSDAEVLLLQRWMLGAQVGTVTLLAGFFTLLARTQPLAEVRLWASAWAANALALGAWLAASLWGGDGLLGRALVGVFASSKTAFAVMLLAGTQFHARVRNPPLPRQALLVVVGVWGLASAVLPVAKVHVTFAQSLLVGALVGTAAITVLRHPRTRTSSWLGAAMLAHAAITLHFVPLYLPTIWGGQPWDPGHLFMAPLLETASDAFVALASLMALQGTVVASLEHLNRELEESQERLRHLVDLDPLTGLSNRRALRPVLAAARTTGAALIVLDIDNFKEINDKHGHMVGDDCLKKVARGLRTFFRLEDGLFRWGGDEFLLICPGVSESTVRTRIAQLQSAVAEGDRHVPSLRLSAGVAMLAPGGEPEAALRDADARMLAGKIGGRAG